MRTTVLAAAILATTTGTLAAAAPSMAATPRHPTVSITASTHRAYPGTTITISGTVHPGEPDHRVTLQRYTNHRWATAARDTLTSTSRYRFTIRPTTTGTRIYRVYDTPKPGWSNATSKTIHIAIVNHAHPKPAPAACYPLTNSGNCYEPGEYCRTSDHGATGIAGDGERIQCEDNNGWRWEPI